MDALTLNAQIQLATATAKKPPVAEVPAPGSGGKDVPASGNAKPVEPVEIDIPEVSVEQAVAQIKDFIANSQRDLQFQVDDATGRTVVSVYGSSGELIRQYPSEEILKIAATLQEQGFNLIDQSA